VPKNEPDLAVGAGDWSRAPDRTRAGRLRAARLARLQADQHPRYRMVANDTWQHSWDWVITPRTPEEYPIVPWIIERRHDHVAVVTMNTNKVNAQNPAFFADLQAAFERLEKEFSDCAVVLTGTGTLFGQVYDLAAAVRMGIVQQTVAPDKLLDAAIAWAALVAPDCYTAYAFSKRALQAATMAAIDAAARLDRDWLSPGMADLGSLRAHARRYRELKGTEITWALPG
jgi:hypothetical protein